MRYSHESVRRIRNVMLTRMGYIIKTRNKLGVTQKTMAEEYGVSISAIRAIKSGTYSGIALDRLIMVADGMKMDYTITVVSRNGRKDATVVLNSYATDPLVQRLTLEAGRLFGR